MTDQMDSEGSWAPLLVVILCIFLYWVAYGQGTTPMRMRRWYNMQVNQIILNVRITPGSILILACIVLHPNILSSLTFHAGFCTPAGATEETTWIARRQHLSSWCGRRRGESKPQTTRLMFARAPLECS